MSKCRDEYLKWLGGECSAPEYAVNRQLWECWMQAWSRCLDLVDAELEPKCSNYLRDDIQEALSLKLPYS